MRKSKYFTEEAWLNLSEKDKEVHLRLDEEEEALQQERDESARKRGFANETEERAFRVREENRKLNEYCARRGITLEVYYKEQDEERERYRQKQAARNRFGLFKNFANCNCRGRPAFTKSYCEANT